MYQVIYKTDDGEKKSVKVSYGQALCAFFMFNDAIAIQGGIMNRRTVPHKSMERFADDTWKF